MNQSIACDHILTDAVCVSSAFKEIVSMFNNNNKHMTYLLQEIIDDPSYNGYKLQCDEKWNMYLA